DGRSAEKRPEQRALLFWIGRAIWTEEVNRRVAGLAEQLVLVRVAEDPERRRVEESDPAIRVDDVQRVGDRSNRPKARDGRVSRLQRRAHHPLSSTRVRGYGIGLLAIPRRDR